MQKKTLQSAITCIGLFCLIDAFADETDANQTAPVEAPAPAALPVLNQEAFMSASPRATHGAHLFVAGEWLLWRLHQEGLPVAIRTRNPVETVLAGPPTTIYQYLLQHGKGRNFNFEWNSGYRIAFGYDWPRDQTTVKLTWLHYFCKAHRKMRAKPGQQLIAVQTHPIDESSMIPSSTDSSQLSFEKADIHGHVHLQQLDLDLDRAVFAGKWFTFTPHFGLRTTWLKQKFTPKYYDSLSYVVFASYAGGTTASPADSIKVNKFSSWWGIGPEAGMDLGLLLGQGFSIFGDLAASIEYGYHHLYSKDSDVTLIEEDISPATIAEVRDGFHTSRSILDMQLGLRWEYLFGPEGRVHLRLDMGWEQHVYFSQNQMLYFVSSTQLGNFESNLGDLTFQGFHLGFRLDY
jgi:hypothetical protein